MNFSRWQFLGALSSFPILLSATALATVTIDPQIPWVADASATVYYSSAASTASLDTDVGYRTIDITKTKATDSTARLNMIRFTLRSDKVIALTAGQSLVVTAWADMASGTKRAVPIAFAGGDCTSSNCQGSSRTHFLAAHYSNQATIELGFYPQDICAEAYAADNGAFPLGCITSGSVGNFDAPDANEATLMKLIFYVTATTSTTDAPAVADLGSESAAISFKVENGAPSFTCTDLNNVYFPADSSILVNTGLFTGTAAATALSPVTTIVAIAKRNGTPDVSTTAFQSHNDNIGRLDYHAGTRVFSGFVNASSANDTANTYTIDFMGRDLAGALAPFSTGCQLTGVQSLEVRGFLKKGNCFIASAAFRSVGDAPVMMLRRFRDRVLLQSFPGRLFVSAYYRWSPEAAVWLIENPEFRIPVLLALVPVQAVAWVFLDFWTRLSFLLGATLVLGLFLRRMHLREGSPS